MEPLCRSSLRLVLAQALDGLAAENATRQRRVRQYRLCTHLSERRAPVADGSRSGSMSQPIGSSFQNGFGPMGSSDDFRLQSPRFVADALALPEGGKKDKLRRERALTLCREELLSVGEARERAGMHKQAFGQHYGGCDGRRHFFKRHLSRGPSSGCSIPSEGNHHPDPQYPAVATLYHPDHPPHRCSTAWPRTTYA